MNRRTLLAAALAAALPFAACAQQEPTEAQAPLPTVPLTITTKGGQAHVFHVEVARTEQQQVTGLMFRRTVPADDGMAFLWNPPVVSRMWMKNTLVPLDMVFVAPDGRIDSIAENTVPESLAEIASTGPVVATIELQGGITSRLGIEVGDRVSAPDLGIGR